MKKIIFRTAITIFAIAIGVTLVIGLSFVGNKSKGPVADIVAMTGNAVEQVEEKMAIEPRQAKRSDKLDWFKAYKHEIKLLLNPTKILFGAFDDQSKTSYKSIINLEDSLHTTFPLMHIYTAWGSKPNEIFPATEVNSILSLGSLPVITWEPWLNDFDEIKIPRLRPVAERDKGGLIDISQGLYDVYLQKWAADAKAINKPIFLRFGHEMNDAYRYPWGPQNNTAKDFVAAWRHVHDIFIKAGAVNVLWIWSPHPAYGYFKEYYPGEKYVDYIGTGTLNYGEIAKWSQWWSFDDIFGKYYPELSGFGKPMMLTEFGSLEVGGNRSKWFNDALNNIKTKYPAVKSVLFFHNSTDNTTTQQTLNWYFINDKMSVEVVKKYITKL